MPGSHSPRLAAAHLQLLLGQRPPAVADALQEHLRMNGHRRQMLTLNRWAVQVQSGGGKGDNRWQ